MQISPKSIRPLFFQTGVLSVTGYGLGREFTLLACGGSWFLQISRRKADIETQSLGLLATTLNAVQSHARSSKTSNLGTEEQAVIEKILTHLGLGPQPRRHWLKRDAWNYFRRLETQVRIGFGQGRRGGLRSCPRADLGEDRTRRSTRFHGKQAGLRELSIG